ncbi:MULTISPECIES: hypothetical protein [unclassified Haloparvum]|jgi:DNA-directed RNA polymerase subunit M/transcription elongation factor TFIIS
MPDCPDCGSELVASAEHEPSEGTHKVFECNSCGTVYEPDEVGAS